MPVASRRLLALLVFYFLIAIPAHAKKQETGFLDRSITVRGATYKYQVFVPDTWTPHEKWPVILFLHGTGERGEDGLQETDVGIGTAIRSDRSRIPAIVVMPQCRKNVWWTTATHGRSRDCLAGCGDQGIPRRRPTHVPDGTFDGRIWNLALG